MIRAWRHTNGMRRARREPGISGRRIILSGWRFQTTLKTDPEWEQIPHPDADLWLTLRDILWKRYQRKRGAWAIIEAIDKLCEKEFGIIIKPKDE